MYGSGMYGRGIGTGPQLGTRSLVSPITAGLPDSIDRPYHGFPGRRSYVQIVFTSAPLSREQLKFHECIDPSGARPQKLR